MARGVLVLLAALAAIAAADPCADATHNCQGPCTPTVDSFTCECELGYELMPDGVTCNDIVECLEDLDDCDANAACTNSPGSFSCACNTGYTGSGVACSNINECALGAHNCAGAASCSDAAGSFTCACNAGYTGSGLSCSDINECSEDMHNCAATAGCTNTAGSFTCACTTGYTGSGVTCALKTSCAQSPCVRGACQAATADGLGREFTCNCSTVPGYGGDYCQQDLNECTLGTHSCQTAQSTCTNTAGSFTCGCNQGYFGPSCADLNECSDNTDNCAAQATCTNVAGSFTCACNQGFSGNGITCQELTTGYVILQPAAGLAPGSITVTVQAVNIFGQRRTQEEGDVKLVIDRSGLYRPGPIDTVTLDITQGQRTYTLQSDVAGRIGLSLALDANPSNLDISSSLTALFASALTGTESPPSGSSFLYFGITFGGVACSAITPEVIQHVVERLATRNSVSVSAITIMSIVCDGQTRQYLSRRAEGTSGLGLELRVQIPESQGVSQFHKFADFVNSGAFLQALKQLGATASVFANATSSSEDNEPTMTINGVDCTQDEWSAWSPCPVTCNDGTNPSGAQHRLRRCPPESQSAICRPLNACPLPGNCSVANGGCDANAACTIRQSDKAAVCTCNSGYIGDGLSCTSVSQKVVDATLTFSGNLAVYAPTVLDQNNLIELIKATLAANLGVSDARFSEFKLTAPSSSKFFCTFTILPPTSLSDAKTADELVVEIRSLSITLAFNNQQLSPSISSSSSSGDTETTTEASDTDWSERETLWLLVGLGSAMMLILLIVASVFVYHRANAQVKSRLGLTKISPSPQGNGNGNGHHASEPTREMLADNEQRWFDDDDEFGQPAHFYPPQH